VFVYTHFHCIRMVLGGVLIDQTETVLYYLSNRWRLKIFRFLEVNCGVVWVIVFLWLVGWLAIHCAEPNSNFQKLLLLGYHFRN